MEGVGELRRWSPGEGLGQAARRYGSSGVPVLPCHHPAIILGPGRLRGLACSCGAAACQAPAEHPVPARWVEEATSDPGRIAAWWRQQPGYNVGLLTGGAFEVLDVPARLGEAALRRCGIRKLAGPVARTGNGRYHFNVTAIGMTNGFVPSQPGAGRSGVFWHGEGGWVIAPPSRHVSGEACRWLQTLDAPLPTAHLVLRELLDARDGLAHDAALGAAAAGERAAGDPAGPSRSLSWPLAR